MNRNKYRVEFIIQVYDTSFEALRDALEALGSDLILEQVEDGNGKAGIIRICIRTDEPHFIFDACSEFGRLKSVKIDEEK